MKLRLALATFVLLLAAVFRLWQIAELPPGLHPDEAFHLLNAQMIASGRSFPIYITGNNGNEPLFAYSAALVLLLLGPVTWAGRLAAAWIGIIGVAATIRLGDEMFPRQGVGWLAGAALAALFWNVDFSRFGSQPILAATAAAATMAGLWRGARSGSPWAFFLAGVSLGLGLDAYVAFRLFPLVPLASGLALMLASRRGRRALLRGGALAGLGALLVYAPLGLWFIQHPEWFFNRFSQTTSGTLRGSSASSNLLSNGLRTLGGLVFQGDGNWRQNLAGRPALDPAQDVFALAGLAALSPRRNWPQAVTLLVWLAVGLAPSVVTVEAPHFGRTTMVTPAIAILLGLGVATAWRWCRRYRLLQLGVALAALFSVGLTARDYFGVWAHSGELFGAFGVEQVRIAQALLAAPAGSSRYTANLPTSPYTVEYVMGEAAYRTLQTYNSANCLLLPTPLAEPAAYAVVNPKGASLLPDLRQAYPAATWTVTTWLADQPYIGLLQIPAGQPPLAPVAVARGADFGGFVRMVGYTVTPGAPRPGGTLTLHVLWQIEQPSAVPLKNFVHLLGRPKADGSVVYAQRDSQPCDDSYATTGWAPGNLLAADMTLDLPADLPAGTYTLQTGWYNPADGVREPVLGDAGPHQDDAAQLQPVVVTQ